jgi:hypothetical protein
VELLQGGLAADGERWTFVAEKGLKETALRGTACGRSLVRPFP